MVKRAGISLKFSSGKYENSHAVSGVEISIFLHQQQSTFPRKDFR